MIEFSLFKKFVRESVLLWIAIAIGLAAFCWFRVWIVSEVDTSRFRELLELLPQDWRRFSPVDFEWLISYLGRTALTLDEPMVMMLIAAWTIVRGSDVVSGELNRGTMEMVLAQPIGRVRVYLQHAFLTTVGLLLLVLIVWLSMSISVWTTPLEETTYPTIVEPFTGSRIPLKMLAPKVETFLLSDKVDPSMYGIGIANLFFFGFFLIAQAMMFSSWDRFRWRTLGILAGIYIVQAMIKVGAMASETFSWLKWLTYFTLYEPSLLIEITDSHVERTYWLGRYSELDELTGLGSLGGNLVLLLLGALCLLIGALVFKRRDLPAPL